MSIRLMLQENVIRGTGFKHISIIGLSLVWYSHGYFPRPLCSWSLPPLLASLLHLNFGCQAYIYCIPHPRMGLTQRLTAEGPRVKVQ